MEHPKIQAAADGSLRLNFGSYGGRVDVAALSLDGITPSRPPRLGAVCLHSAEGQGSSDAWWRRSLW